MAVPIRAVRISLAFRAGLRAVALVLMRVYALGELGEAAQGDSVLTHHHVWNETHNLYFFGGILATCSSLLVTTFTFPAVHY